MTVSMGLAGFIIAFVRGWKLAIVVTAVIPFLLLAGFFNNHYLKKASDFMQKVTSRARIFYLLFQRVWLRKYFTPSKQ
jgi:hypothetical protein